MIYFLDARAALNGLFSLLMLPAVFMIVLGLRFWYRGAQQQQEDRLRMGKMLTMFGAVFFIILLICSWFLTSRMGLDT